MHVRGGGALGIFSESYTSEKRCWSIEVCCVRLWDMRFKTESYEGDRELLKRRNLV